MLDGSDLSENANVAVVIDGTTEGLLTAVYRYYHGGLRPKAIYDGSVPALQQTLGEELLFVETDANQADIVLVAIRDKLTADSASFIEQAMAHAETDKLFDIFRYILLAFKTPRQADRYEQLDFVINTHKLAKAVRSEAHLLKGFTRFKKTAQGVLYAEIEPKHAVLPILCEHFIDRLGNERWIIHDVKRRLAGAYNADECVIATVPDGVQAGFREDEREELYQQLWTAFYHTIGIQERKNSKLRRQNSPKYFWKHMTEHKRPFNNEKGI